MRATALPASSLDKAIDGHVPTWIPDGFGLAGAWGPPSQGLGPDFAAEAVWADDECREIDLTYWNRIEGVSRLPDKPRVGDWFVTDKPGACGNAVLGDARCLWYLSPLSKPTGEATTTIILSRGIAPPQERRSFGMNLEMAHSGRLVAITSRRRPETGADST
jgi:hypothetical protein